MAYNAPVFNRILRAAALCVWLSVPLSAFADKATVLVLPFENQTGESTVDWLGEGLAELTAERLQAEPGLHVFSRDERLSLLRKSGIPSTVSVSRATVIQLGWDVGADIVVLGTMSGR